MTEQSTRRGIAMMVTATIVFAVQDGISRHLAETYNVLTIIMIRYWFFALLVLALALRSAKGPRGFLRTSFPKLQILRGVLLIVQIVVMVHSFVHFGLVASHAILTCYPLVVAALSGPILGERVGWRRWIAVGLGAVGVFVILQPGREAFSPLALAPLAAAVMFALYGLLTRYVARGDTAMVSFALSGLVGVVLVTPFGLYSWQPMAAADWGWMALLCCTGVMGHAALIRAYDFAEANTVQPFSYLQLVWISFIGVAVFGELLESRVVIGTVIVASAGLFTLFHTGNRAAAGEAAISDPAISDPAAAGPVEAEPAERPARIGPARADCSVSDREAPR